MWDKWQFDIKTDMKSTGLEGVDWIPVPQDTIQRLALLNLVINLRIP